MKRYPSGLAAPLLCALLPHAWAQPDSRHAPIQDNSFLIEEAYNQERGVVQHINTFSRMWNSRDWAWTLTQEWPALDNPRHQFSYTLSGLHAGSVAGSGVGLGDVAFHYRYQWLAGEDGGFAFSPRLSLILPTGNPLAGRGSGAPGFQFNLPVSRPILPRLVTHWNLGGTFVRHARGAEGWRASTAGYNFGQSFIFLAHPSFNLMLETTASRFQSPCAPGVTEWSGLYSMAPGVRWAHDFASGLQIVPGVAFVMGIGPSAGEHGIFLYLSFEHPFGRGR